MANSFSNIKPTNFNPGLLEKTNASISNIQNRGRANTKALGNAVGAIGNGLAKFFTPPARTSTPTNTGTNKGMFGLPEPKYSIGFGGITQNQEPSAPKTPAPLTSNPTHPEGGPKSSTITTTNPIGGTTTHKIDYIAPVADSVQTGTNSGQIQAVMTQLAEAKAKLAKAQAEQNSTKTDTSTTTPPPTDFKSIVGAGTEASKKAVNSGQSQIQNSTNGLQNTQNNPQDATSDVQKTLKGISTEQTPAVLKAQQEYNTFAKASPMLLSDVVNNPNVAAEVSVGRGQALGQVLSAEQQALQGNVANALQGQGQQIDAANQAGGLANTAQGQGIQAGTSVLGAGTTQQGQGLSGLGNVGSLTQRVQVPYGNQYIDPITGQSVTGGASGVDSATQSAISNIVNSMNNGSITSYADAEKALGAYANNPNAVLALQSALKQSNPNFNISGSNAQAGSLGDLTQQVNDLQSKASGIDTNFTLAINTAQAGGVTDTNTPILNKIQQNVQKGLVSNQAVIDYQNSIQQLQTAITELGGGTIDPNISQNALKSLQNQVKSQITNTVNGYNQQINKIKGGSGTSGYSSGTVVKTTAGDINTNW
jgi:hypothetical protein